jgi:K+-transporting ATPase c subunit
MALSKVIVIDKIEVLEDGRLQVRTATRVLEDGVELSSSFHRHVVVPSTKASGSWADTDISGEDARVQAIATATWTSSVKTAYQEMIDAQATP